MSVLDGLGCCGCAGIKLVEALERLNDALSVTRDVPRNGRIVRALESARRDVFTAMGRVSRAKGMLALRAEAEDEKEGESRER